MHEIQMDSYNIFIDASWNELKTFLKQREYSSILILVDENTKEYCLPELESALLEYPLNIIEIKSGESNKSLRTCEHIWNKMLHFNADRHSVMLNLGGGVIGDMGGFCASTFKRGMDFIQIPTTLLAQVDASIGGKLGIDINDTKNTVGLFNTPEMVFIQSSFLNSLPKRQLTSGFAEIIKHALIKQAAHWEQIISNKEINVEFSRNLLKDSLLVKKNIVDEDPFEKNVRKALNFGHTVGHALESLSLKSNHPLLHGEAIAIGIICEAFISFRRDQISRFEIDSISKQLIDIYGKVSLDNFKLQELMPYIYQDKKNKGQAINCTLLEGIGKFQIDQTITESEIRDSLEFYINL